MKDSVTLMTLHSAKGLEFNTVFLVGMEEGIFPGYKSIGEPKELEEERRLCYVGITRAKNNLCFTCAKHRTIFGSTSYNSMSRFIEEIPEQYLEGIQQIQNSSKEEDEYQSPYTWGYKNMNTYKIDTNKKQEIENVVNKNKPNTYNFRTPESFLKSITNKSNEEQVDLSKYKARIRI